MFKSLFQTFIQWRAAQRKLPCARMIIRWGDWERSHLNPVSSPFCERHFFRAISYHLNAWDRLYMRSNKRSASICIEKPVALVGQQMEQSFLQESFRKKGIASDVVLFSHCYRNERNITEPFASSDSRTMLLGEMHGSFPQYCQWKEPFHLNCFFPYVPFHLTETEFPPVLRLIVLRSQVT